MTGGPHFYGMAIDAARRRAEMYAWADRDRLVRQAQPKTDRRAWAELAVVWVTMLIVLLVAARIAVA